MFQGATIHDMIDHIWLKISQVSPGSNRPIVIAYKMYAGWYGAENSRSSGEWYESNRSHMVVRIECNQTRAASSPPRRNRLCIKCGRYNIILITAIKAYEF